MRVEFFFLVLLGFASSLPLKSDQNVDLSTISESLQTTEVGARNGIIESTILALLEILRNLMINGSENFPVLDPIYVENIHLDENILNIPKAYITIKDLTIKDISTFAVEDIAFSVESLLPQRFRLDIDLLIPVVNVNASHYDLSLTVFGGLIFGKGDMSIRIVKPRVKGHFVVGLRSQNNGTFLVMHECKLGIGLESFDPVITGLFNNQAASDFVSAYLRNLVREMLVFFEEEITNTLSTVVLVVSNLIFNEIDLGNIFPRPDEV